MPVALPETRQAIRQIHEARLQELLREILPANRFQQAKFDAAGLTAADIRSLDDWQKVPFTFKSELAADQAQHPLYGSNLTYPLSRYTRLHQTSGTTGSPIRWLDTSESWGALLRSWSQLFPLMGLTPVDRLFFAFSFGPFLGFWAGFDGANRLGNLCLAGGGMSSAARVRFLLDHQVTVVCCTPTYAMRLAETAAELGEDLAKSPVRALLVAGEPGGNIPATRQLLESAWGARVVDHWGMTEIGPLAIETPDAPGTLTVLETECIAEILDPATGQAQPPGIEGELVITTLGRGASPILRYRTGDRVKALPGKGLLRLDGGILGRVDDMITIRGNNLYPAALENVIRQFPAVVEFRIEVRAQRAMQHVRIEIEPAKSADPVALCEEIVNAVRVRWNFQAEVVAVAELPRFEMKGQRFRKIES